MSGNFTWKPSPLSSTIFWLARGSVCFSLKCPPALYFTVLLNEKADLSIAMYVTLTDIQNGEPVSVPGTACGGLEVALCELTYYHRWLNISAEIKNSMFDGHTVLGIPKGTITSVSWTKRRSGLWALNSVCMPQPGACIFPQKNAWCWIRGWPTS